MDKLIIRIDIDLCSIKLRLLFIFLMVVLIEVIANLYNTQKKRNIYLFDIDSKFVLNENKVGYDANSVTNGNSQISINRIIEYFQFKHD
jgi:hypothetical protein